MAPSWETESPNQRDAKFAVEKTQKFAVVTMKKDEKAEAPPGGGTKRRDTMQGIERRVQAAWKAQGTFEADADDTRPKKFLVTFP